MTTIKNQEAYASGYNSKKEEINSMGWEAARNKFKLDNPLDTKFSSLEMFHFVKGECEALLKNQ